MLKYINQYINKITVIIINKWGPFVCLSVSLSVWASIWEKIISFYFFSSEVTCCVVFILLCCFFYAVLRTNFFSFFEIHTHSSVYKKKKRKKLPLLLHVLYIASWLKKLIWIADNYYYFDDNWMMCYFCKK